MAWKKGPLPPDTWHWGGVVLVGEEGYGFYFADFRGDHILIIPGQKRVEASDVAWYDNNLELPDIPKPEGPQPLIRKGFDAYTPENVFGHPVTPRGSEKGPPNIGAS